MANYLVQVSADLGDAGLCGVSALCVASPTFWLK